MDALDVQIINAFAGLTTGTDRAIGVTPTSQTIGFVNAISMQGIASLTTGAIPIIHTGDAGHDIHAFAILASTAGAAI